MSRRCSSGAPTPRCCLAKPALAAAIPPTDSHPTPHPPSSDPVCHNAGSLARVRVTRRATATSKLRAQSEGLMHATASSLLARTVSLTPIGRAYARAAAGDPAVDFSTRALAVLDIDVAVQADALRQVPLDGPLIVVANHPLGALDGLALLKSITRVRADVRLLGNRWLRYLPEMRDCIVPVDIFGSPSNAIRRNGMALRAAIQWLTRGGCIGMF